MRIARDILLVTLGVCIGLAVAGHWSRVSGETSGRFQMVDSNKVASSDLVLVRDSKSDGCWLLAQGAQGVGLAPAPVQTCR